jgi:NAD-dependent dihydropyrimidine dehydrogenase PreA subunit
VSRLLTIDRSTCTGCALCVDACPTGAISLDEEAGVSTIDPALCNECLACAEVCPTGAIRRRPSSELVPAGADEIIEGQVVESQVMPYRTPGSLAVGRKPGRLATLAGTALTFAGSWLLPRVTDALLNAVEHRLAGGTSTASSVAPLRSKRGPLQRGMGGRRSGWGRQRRRRRRGG